MAIRLDNVDYQKILNNINIDFKDAKISGLIGNSGSGKTVLLELLNALRVPSKGQIVLDDAIINNKFNPKNINSYRIKVGLIYEFATAQFFCNTVVEELKFSLKNFNIHVDDIETRIKKVLKDVDLSTEILTRDPLTLSHGEQRKVAIASILIFDPKIIIFDEPTLGLDGKSKNQIISLIKSLKAKHKKTIIIASKNSELIYNLCDYIYLIARGQVVFEEKKEKFFLADHVKSNGITIPAIISFIEQVKITKGISLPIRDEIDDLIKDVYRYVK